ERDRGKDRGPGEEKTDRRRTGEGGGGTGAAGLPGRGGRGANRPLPGGQGRQGVAREGAGDARRGHRPGGGGTEEGRRGRTRGEQPAEFFVHRVPPRVPEEEGRLRPALSGGLRPAEEQRDAL